VAKLSTLNKHKIYILRLINLDINFASVFTQDKACDTQPVNMGRLDGSCDT